MGKQQRWWERRGLPRAAARAATLALLVAAALLPVWVVFFWKRPGAHRGAVLGAEARADAGGTRHDASWGARDSFDANVLESNPDAFVGGMEAF
jgi:hypothetical protein